MDDYKTYYRILKKLLEQYKGGIVFATTTLDVTVNILPKVMKTKGIFELKEDKENFVAVPLEILRNSETILESFIKKLIASNEFLDKVSYMGPEIFEECKENFKANLEEFIAESMNDERIDSIIAFNAYVTFQEIFPGYIKWREKFSEDGMFLYEGIPFYVIKPESFSDKTVVNKFIDKCFYDMDVFETILSVRKKELN